MTPTDDHDAANAVVLIVEDNGLMRAMLKRLLRDAYPSMVIHEAPNGAAARDAMRLHRPQVVLMDVNLPDADGIALTAEVLRLKPKTGVIIVTMLEGAPYRERARKAGAFGYVVKEKVHCDLLPLIECALKERCNCET
jgi:DNA-binding NarL/FixJ family response regulator